MLMRKATQEAVASAGKESVEEIESKVELHERKVTGLNIIAVYPVRDNLFTSFAVRTSRISIFFHSSFTKKGKSSAEFFFER